MELKQENKVIETKIKTKSELNIELQANIDKFINVKVNKKDLKNINYLNFILQENNFYHFQLLWPNIKVQEKDDDIFKLNFNFKNNSKTVFYILFKKSNHHFLNLRLEENSSVELFLINIHDYNIDLTINGELLGEKSNLNIYSLSVLQNSTKNQYINVIHKGNNSNANIINSDLCLGENTIKNRIINIVPANIRFCSSHQVIKCLNFDKKSIINNEPILGVYNNDVKCSHGCAVGDINLNEFIYLFSRGFSKQEIKKMLTLGYSVEILKNLYDIKIETKILQSLKKTINKFFNEKKDK
ncbi:SufD family Fe-S cluster assembly protein [Mycoplasma sp. SG1]|uniref:SufD family Fe-S cluster assembly protein n=1 Tax=Mycoplasma sp. SG1 TaxID=2810348 RepID=UPI00202553C1|nr:SufD family Fe-S cluster assembly protein [Mycoplasma sp. SG1]URM52835.1 SufD family Fe-S cluster assembly protein [Mycoplasma sp. SG1]